MISRIPLTVSLAVLLMVGLHPSHAGVNDSDAVSSPHKQDSETAPSESDRIPPSYEESSPPSPQSEEEATEILASDQHNEHLVEEAIITDDGGGTTIGVQEPREPSPDCPSVPTLPKNESCEVSEEQSLQTLEVSKTSEGLLISDEPRISANTPPDVENES